MAAPKHRLPDGRTPVLISAHHPELLRADAAALLGYLDREPGTDIGPIAAQLSATRRIRRYRTVIRAVDRAELTEGLRAVADGTEHRLVAASAVSSPERLAFVFPGQGSQWLGMGALAYRSMAVYRVAADMCASAFEAAGTRSPLRYLTATMGEDASPFQEIEIEGAQFTHAVALAALWRWAGFAPDVAVGHSLGEVAAAYTVGAITLEQAVLVVSARASLVDRLPGRYAVAALAVSVAEARALIADAEGWVELSVVNAAASVAVSGDRDAVLGVVAAVRDSGRLAKEIAVGFPVHTSVLEPLRADLRRRLTGHRFADSAVQFIGAAIGDVVPAGAEFHDYWYANLRDVVRFDRAVEAAAGRGVRSFVELSAHPTLLYATGSVLAENRYSEPAVLVGSGRRESELPETLSANMMTAAVADPAFGWRDLIPAAERLAGFPNVPMRAQHIWAQPEPLPEPSSSIGVTVAAEQWAEMPLPGAPGAGTVAVLELGRGPLAGALRAALQRRLGAALVAPIQAHTLIVVAPDALDDPEPRAAVETLADLVDAGLLGYANAIGTDCRRVCLVTMRGEQVRPQDPPARPGPAALAAMHRSLGFEHPEVEFTHLDLPAGDIDPAAVIDPILAATGSTALRADGDRSTLWRRGFAEDTAVAAPLRIPDEVLISGGNGAIAGHFVRELTERGARRIVLLSRRGADRPAVTARHGTELVSVHCDVTDAAAVASAAAEHGGSGASLLVHAAGAAAFGPASQLDAAALRANCAAKIIGLTHLTTYWPLRPDARILLCSSVSGVWGGRGHAGYAAANRVLDVMATGLRGLGRNCTAVRWGLWQAPETGIIDTAEAANITRSGLRPMPPAAAIAAGLSDRAGDPLVYVADSRRLQLFLTDTPEARPEPITPALSEPAAVVRTELAAVLDLADAGALDLDSALFDLGIDSLLAVDLRKRLNRRLGCTVALSALLGGITGSELVGQLDQQKVDTARD